MSFQLDLRTNQLKMIFSEAVNLTFRIEGLTRPLGCKLLVTSEFLEDWDAGARQFESLGSHAVKGFSAEVEVFGPLQSES